MGLLANILDILNWSHSFRYTIAVVVSMIEHTTDSRVHSLPRLGQRTGRLVARVLLFHHDCRLNEVRQLGNYAFVLGRHHILYLT